MGALGRGPPFMAAAARIVVLGEDRGRQAAWRWLAR
jgi:hypothetical protein